MKKQQLLKFTIKLMEKLMDLHVQLVRVAPLLELVLVSNKKTKI